MSSQPQVSVITTMYNHEEFISECIESVQASKYTNYEHILVDDCSNDQTIAIAQQYAQRDKRIKIVKNKYNLGDYPNRNNAATYAQGKYLKYVDGDDMISPWLLNLQVDCMEMFPTASAGLFVYGAKQNYKPALLNPLTAIIDYYAGRTDILNRSPLGAIIRKDSFNQVGGFPNKKYVGDFELWIKLNTVFPLVALPTLHSHYRIHPNQESAKLRQDYTIHFNYFRAAIDALEYAKQKGINFETIEQAINRKTCRTVLSSLKKMQISKAVKLKTLTDFSWAEIISHARR